MLSLLGRHVFGGGPLYYAPPVQHVRRARARGEHRVRGLPAARQYPRARQLHAAPTRGPRRPARVLERHHRRWRSSPLLLVWLFRGNTNALVPLYAIGVFVCFTLSQAGMVVHWWKTRDARLALASRRSTGSARSPQAVVTIIQVVTKFTAGGWIIVLIIPLIIWCCVAIHRHYETFAEEIALHRTERRSCSCTTR